MNLEAIIWSIFIFLVGPIMLVVGFDWILKRSTDE